MGFLAPQEKHTLKCSLAFCAICFFNGSVIGISISPDYLLFDSTFSVFLQEALELQQVSLQLVHSLWHTLILWILKRHSFLRCGPSCNVCYNWFGKFSIYDVFGQHFFCITAYFSNNYYSIDIGTFSNF